MSRRAAYLKSISYAKSSCWLAEGSGEQITQVPALFAGAGKTSEQKHSVQALMLAFQTSENYENKP
jgi:hypothetical protein